MRIRTFSPVRGSAVDAGQGLLEHLVRGLVLGDLSARGEGCGVRQRLQHGVDCGVPGAVDRVRAVFRCARRGGVLPGRLLPGVGLTGRLLAGRWLSGRGRAWAVAAGRWARTETAGLRTGAGWLMRVR